MEFPNMDGREGVLTKVGVWGKKYLWGEFRCKYFSHHDGKKKSKAI